MLDTFHNWHTDQMGNTIFLGAPPRRIVSLVPSQSELLAWLGLDEQVVGITRFCVHPKTWNAQKNRIGGTKDVRIERVRALKPDLIIGNKEENTRVQIEELAEEFPVWMSDVKTLDDALEMISAIGKMTDRSHKATILAQQIRNSFERLDTSIAEAPRYPVVYLIWKNPWMAAGKGTFIDAMLLRAGLVNVVEQERYPELCQNALANLGAKAVLLSSEPFPFREKHIEELEGECDQADLVTLVDGEPFSWYGSRLLDAPAYFLQLRKKIADHSGF